LLGDEFLKVLKDGLLAPESSTLLLLRLQVQLGRDVVADLELRGVVDFLENLVRILLDGLSYELVKQAGPLLEDLGPQGLVQVF